MGKQDRGAQASRRSFLTAGAAAAVAGVAASEASAQTAAPATSINWDMTADVVIIGAGVAGLPAAITARDLGASVIVVEENYDIGGRGMLSGGRVSLGGGHALQQKMGIKDSPDQVFTDWVRHDHGESRYSDRDMVRVFADEAVSAHNFLIDNGVEFIEKPIMSPDASRVERIFVTKEWHIPSEVIAPHHNRNGSGLVRRLAESARKKGAQILLKHKMTSIVREQPASGKVLGIEVQADGKTLNIRASKGVIVATGGHTGNVDFRRMFDPRLTEEYQQACLPYVHQSASGEIAAMALGAALWSTGNQTNETGAAITKTRHIGIPLGLRLAGVRAGQPDVPAGQGHRPDGEGLAGHHHGQPVRQAVLERERRLLQVLQRRDGLARRQGQAERRRPDLGDLRRRRRGAREVEARAAARRSGRLVRQADTLAELAGRIKNPYQTQPMSGDVLAETVTRYNSFVTEGADADFKRPKPMFKIEKPPFYAAWATPILHDTLTGLRTSVSTEVIDIRGEAIPHLYCAGETQGGFAQHGLARCIVFGRIAGRVAAKNGA